ncbi:MAG: hypothetical protein Fur0010_18700 [Bdellovibrio sp.]
MWKSFSILVFSFIAFTSAYGACGIGGTSGGSKATWDEILSCPELTVNFPTVDIEGRPMRYNEICIEGEQIRSKKKIYIKPISDEDFDFKLKEQDEWFRYIFVDRVHEVVECVQWEGEICVEERVLTIVIPLRSEIEVYRQANDGRWILFFTKDYELPVCTERK